MILGSGQARVALVVAIRDESRTLDAWLASVLGQVRGPDEIIIVDGGSLDGTAARLKAFAAIHPRVAVLEVPRGSTIAHSRNTAIRHTRADIVAVADGGTLLPPHWLESLVRPLLSGEPVALVGGPPLPGGSPGFQRRLSQTITPHSSEHRSEHFLPGGASMAFPRVTWETAGGFPEDLVRSEDLAFDRAVIKAGGAIRYVPEAGIVWLPRETLAQFFVQYYMYARGDVQARLWPRRHALRFATYGAFLSPVLRVPGNRLFFALATTAMAARIRLHLRRLRLHDREASWGSHALVPIIVVVGDVAKMVGYASEIASQLSKRDHA